MLHGLPLIVVALLPVHGCTYQCTATGSGCSSANRSFSYESVCTANPKCFQHYETPAALTSHVSRQQQPQLAKTASSLVVMHSNEQGVRFGKGFLVHTLVRHEAICSLPLNPDEVVPWDSAQLPELDHTGDSCLALPKFNLQVSSNHLTLAPTPTPRASAFALARALTLTEAPSPSPAPSP